MIALFVKLLDQKALVPTVAYPGEDLGYDLYALEDTEILFSPTPVRTGISIQFGCGYGGIIKDRSSMAKKGIVVSGGVIDAGYRGEIIVLLNQLDRFGRYYKIKAGDKIAQIIPQEILTSTIFVVSELSDSNRKEKGFGSSGS